MDPYEPTSSLKRIKVRGVELAYTDTGSDSKKKTALLIHANLSDWRSWELVVPLLSPEFRVVTYSRRYSWPNAGIPEATADSWESHSDDAAEVIEQLHLAPVCVIGNSSGATIALLLAQRRPELVMALVLEEPPVIGVFLPETPPSFMDVVRLLWLHPWSFWPVICFGAVVIGPTTNAYKRGDDDAALDCFCRGVLGPDYKTRLSQERKEQIRRNAKPHQALFRHGSLPNFSECDARSIKLPVLVLTGEKTVSAHRHIDACLASLLPDAEEIQIADARHLIHEDNPEAVARAAIKFMVHVGSRTI